MKLLITILITMSFGISAQSKIDKERFFISVFAGENDLISEKLSTGFSPNYELDGVTPLQATIKNNNVTTLKILLDHKANPNVKDRLTGMSMLTYSLRHALYAIAKTLLEYQANPNLQDKEGNTALHYLAMNNDIQGLNYLLEYKPNTTIFNKEGEAPLHTACRIGSDYAVQILLQSGIDINQIDKHGNTCSHYVAGFCQSNVLAKIEMFNPNRKIKNKKGLTASDLSRMNGCNNLIAGFMNAN